MHTAGKSLNCSAITLSRDLVFCRSARNLSYQDKLPVEGSAEQLLELKGQDLIGVPLKVSTLASCSPESTHPALSTHSVSKQRQAKYASPTFSTLYRCHIW